MARASAVALVLIGLVALAAADVPNWWKSCSVEAEGCQGTNVPSDYDPATFAAAPDSKWLPTCCKLGLNPTYKQTGFFCFASSNGPDHCIGGGGDPLMNGFDGRTFMFDGVPGHMYSILSERDLAVTGHFTPAHMFDHEGTYITTMGLQYKDIRVKVHVVHDGSLEVEVQNLPLVMDSDSNTKTAVYTPNGADAGENVTVVWQYYRPGYGHAAEIVTPLVNLMIWSSPPANDKGGVPQPAYLNFNTGLLRAPANGEMHGILGQSYSRVVELAEKAAAAGSDVDLLTALDDAPDFEGDTEDYAVSTLFATDFTFNRFGGGAEGGERSSRRILKDAVASGEPSSKAIAFPLYAFKRQ